MNNQDLHRAHDALMFRRAEKEGELAEQRAYLEDAREELESETETEDGEPGAVAERYAKLKWRCKGLENDLEYITEQLAGLEAQMAEFGR